MWWWLVFNTEISILFNSRIERYRKVNSFIYSAWKSMRMAMYLPCLSHEGMWCHISNTHNCKNADKVSGWCLLAPIIQEQNQRLGKLHYHPVSQPWFKPRPPWFPGQILPPHLLEYTSVSRRAWMRNKNTVDPNWILLSCFTHMLVTTKHLASNHSLENVSLYFWYHNKEGGLIHCRQLTVIFSWMTIPNLLGYVKMWLWKHGTCIKCQN